jgi:23S rRNA (adenine2503-C2)-methyltransferase
MKLLDQIQSKIDKTVKFVFQLDSGLISEASYINKDDGKDIICVSCQTGCQLMCRFCHTTDCKEILVRNLWGDEIYEQVSQIRNILGLKDKMLLVSYMGCGEPLMNVSNVVVSMLKIRHDFEPCRFAIATMIPQNKWYNYFDLAHEIELYKLNVKIHLSLHFVDDEVRKEWMPAALPIRPSIAALEFYKRLGLGSVEIHYALIEGVNDDANTGYKLAALLRDRDIPVKLLQYNERKTIPNKSSTNVQGFMDALKWAGIPVEYYVPPGSDIGSSCGAFLMDYYEKYNKADNAEETL